MSLWGLSPLAFVIGALALAAIVGALHLLRVRLRQVDVDTLLFFRLAGAVKQPRVLPGRPSRWLAFLLALAAVLAGWSAVADPHGSAVAASRVVVIEPAAGELRQARLAAAQQVCAARGLGPRGAVLSAGAEPMVLLRASEPFHALAVRAAAMPDAGSATCNAAALRTAQDLLVAGDEIVWIGGEPPRDGTAMPLRVLRRGAVPLVQLTALRWHRHAQGLDLVCDLQAAATGRAVLRGSPAEMAATFAVGCTELRLGPVATAHGLSLRFETGGDAYELPLPEPEAAPLRVHLRKDVPADIDQAVAALIAVDADFAESDEERAEVLVTAIDPDDRRPCLVVGPGTGAGPRQALPGDALPVALSLRDRIRRDAPALPVRAGDCVWIEDCRQGGALAKAEARDGRLRVSIVEWLLQPATHADVPLLIAGALRALGGRPRELLAPAGQPVAIPDGFAGTVAAASGATLAKMLPASGQLRSVFPRAGTVTLTAPAGSTQVHVLPVAAARASDGAADPALENRGGDGTWLPWLLALLVVILCIDGWLFHRGRLP
jgi:hypothetical protein